MHRKLELNKHTHTHACAHTHRHAATPTMPRRDSEVALRYTPEILHYNWTE